MEDDDLRYHPDRETPQAESSTPNHHHELTTVSAQIDYILLIIQSLVVSTKQAWRTIESDGRTNNQTYKEYYLVFSAVPIVSPALGLLLSGGGLIGAIKHILVSAIALHTIPFLLGPIVSGLSERYGGIRDNIRSFKLLVYSLAPAFAASLLLVVPGKNVLLLSALLSLHGFYLYNEGANILLKIPESGRKGFAVSSLILISALALVIGTVLVRL